MADPVSEFTSVLQRSLTVRLLLIGFLCVVLLIPIVMIGLLVGERETRRDEAVTDVGSKWGGGQTIIGPALVVPVTRRWMDTGPDRAQVERIETRGAIFLPAKLRVKGALESQTLSRGIFVVPVYRMNLTLEGEFSQPKPADLGVAAGDVQWAQAHLALGISEVRAIQDQVAVVWNGQPAPFLPGPGGFADGGGGINAPVPVTASATTYTFSIPLKVRGSVSAYFVPTAMDTSVELTSNFQHPNFQGAWLPTDRTVSPDGFRALWSVPFLGRGYPQSWISQAGGPSEVIQKSKFGVELRDPVDPYRMASRSVKYAALFILLTFTSVWLVEVLTGVLVHPVQYLMLGAALCLFYLLELSLSEHIGFVAAYGIAALAVIGMIGGYSVVALKKARRAAVVSVGVTLLYGYLYVLLTNEDYALLIGSIGLFIALALVMLLTRRIDWYAIGGRTGAKAEPARPD
jgi:inner membrane protein